MPSYDFDLETQEIFNLIFGDFKKTDWKKWLSINSKEEYEEIAIKLSGLSDVVNLREKIKIEKTESKDFSISIKNFLKNNNNLNPLVFCHTSGTTNSNPKALKWFHMSKDLVNQLWAPGMQAIFESSGLDSNSSAVIFVPSRMNFDGVNYYEGTQYTSLYSAEFSQRIVLATLKPKDYVFAQYRNSKDLEIITKILSMNDISIISAPATTVFGWLDIDRLEEGILKSIKDVKVDDTNPIFDSYLKKFNNRDSRDLALELQRALSEKLSKVTLIFGVSSLSQRDWDLLRDFMHWKKGEEKYTSLYVASEIGPFASNLNTKTDQMYVFPLTLPALEHNGKTDLISRTKYKKGRLFVSRISDVGPLININTDDVIYIRDQENLPTIESKVLRHGFQLKYPIKISEKIEFNQDYNIFAGDFFLFNGIEIYEPRQLLDLLRDKCQMMSDAILLDLTEKSLWKLIIQKNNCQEGDIQRLLLLKKNGDITDWITNNDAIELSTLDDQPIQFMKNREEILIKVRSGELPKGILKKWPLYVALPS